MSTAAEVMNRDPSLSGMALHNDESGSYRSPLQSTKNTKQSGFDVLHAEMESKRRAKQAELGHGSMLNLADLVAQDQFIAQEIQQVQMAATNFGEHNPLSQNAQRAVMDVMRALETSTEFGKELQRKTFRSERAKKDAQFTTDEPRGLAPGKEIESIGNTAATT